MGDGKPGCSTCGGGVRSLQNDQQQAEVTFSMTKPELMNLAAKIVGGLPEDITPTEVRIIASFMQTAYPNIPAQQPAPPK